MRFLATIFLVAFLSTPALADGGTVFNKYDIVDKRGAKKPPAATPAPDAQVVDPLLKITMVALPHCLTPQQTFSDAYATAQNLHMDFYAVTGEALAKMIASWNAHVHTRRQENIDVIFVLDNNKTVASAYFVNKNKPTCELAVLGEAAMNSWIVDALQPLGGGTGVDRPSNDAKQGEDTI